MSDSNHRRFLDLNIFRWEIVDKYGHPIDSTIQKREDIISNLLEEDPEFLIDNDEVYFNMSLLDNHSDGFMDDNFWFRFIYHNGKLKIDNKYFMELSIYDAEKHIEKILLDNDKFELPPLYEIR